MMTGLDSAGCCVKDYNILTGSGVVKEDNHEIMEIEFAAMRTGTFDTHPRSKRFEVCDVEFLSKQVLEWSDTSGGVYKAIV
jgi:hypothetical protein